jgi:hypothetical protein
VHPAGVEFLRLDAVENTPDPGSQNLGDAAGIVQIVAAGVGQDAIRVGADGGGAANKRDEGTAGRIVGHVGGNFRAVAVVEVAEGAAAGDDLVEVAGDGADYPKGVGGAQLVAQGLGGGHDGGFLVED